MNPLSLLGGGALPSMSSSATSGNAEGGYQDTGSGSFNFGTGSGATASAMSPVMIAVLAVAASGAGFLLCRVIRK